MMTISILITFLLFFTILAPTSEKGFDLSQMGSTSLGIGVGYLVFALMIVFALLGLGMLVLKSIAFHKNHSDI